LPGSVTTSPPFVVSTESLGLFCFALMLTLPWSGTCVISLGCRGRCLKKMVSI
jgi:hypothetical protein